MDAAAVDVEGNVESRALFQDIECGAIAFQLALIGADRPEPAAVLVIDIIPVFGCLDEADLAVVRLRAQGRDRQKQNNVKDDSVHNFVNLGKDTNFFRRFQIIKVKSGIKGGWNLVFQIHGDRSVSR